MFRIVFISALLALVAAQNQYNRDPKTAAILTEERYQQGDGKFGAAYTQEDGTDFKEETDADGTRRGSYSYIDPTGAKKTVSYTAGKHGFVATGDHLPVAPPAPPQPIPQQQYQPQSQYQGNQPQYKAAPANYDRGDEANFDDGSYDERYNNPSFSGNNAPNSYRAPAPQPQYQQPQQQYKQPQPQYQPQPQQQYQPQPQQQQYQPQPQQNYQPQPQPQYNQYTTESPHRFQPPGKLSLNRTPDGYSYSFNKA